MDKEKEHCIISKSKEVSDAIKGRLYDGNSNIDPIYDWLSDSEFAEKLMADFTHIRVVGVESFLYITE